MLQIQVLLALAELLSEQLKCRRKSSGSSSKGQETFPSRSIDDMFSFLHGPQSEDKDCFICVVVHNIDGPALRDPESQQTLARLASCSHIRIIASIDHVNAPLCKHYSLSLSLIIAEFFCNSFCSVLSVKDF